jgi:hypothetical protein
MFKANTRNSTMKHAGMLRVAFVLALLVGPTQPGQKGDMANSI